MTKTNQEEHASSDANDRSFMLAKNGMVTVEIVHRRFFAGQEISKPPARPSPTGRPGTSASRSRWTRSESTIDSLAEVPALLPHPASARSR